jgi:hypothetical protein
MRGNLPRLMAGGVLGALVIGALMAVAFGGAQKTEAQQHVNVEVVEIGSRFVPDETPVFDDDGFPAYGAEFVTQGYIYPAGTVEEGHDGINADGSAEYPDKVIGLWTCRGWHIGDGAHSVGQPWVATTQIFAFDGPTDFDQKGATTIVTDGFELPDVGILVQRAITGGTGAYQHASGVQRQSFLGFNETFGVGLRVELIVD